MAHYYPTNMNANAYASAYPGAAPPRQAYPGAAAPAYHHAPVMATTMPPQPPPPLLTVTIPLGLGPGSPFQIRQHNGALMQVTVPPGCHGGMTIQVRPPAPAVTVQAQASVGRAMYQQVHGVPQQQPPCVGTNPRAQRGHDLGAGGVGSFGGGTRHNPPPAP